MNLLIGFEPTGISVDERIRTVDLAVSFSRRDNKGQVFAGHDTELRMHRATFYCGEHSLRCLESEQATNRHKYVVACVAKLCC